MVTFPVSEGKWGVEGNWHIDGMHDYVRYPFSKEIGIVLIMYFSDVNENCGGTAVAEGSHLSVARSLISSGLKGSKSKPLVESVLHCPNEELFNMIELTGEAGDVILLHPLLIHARSKNLAVKTETEDGVRFMCHPTIALKKHMDFRQPHNQMSVLEKSIVKAASVDSVLLDNLCNITPEACEQHVKNKTTKSTNEIIEKSEIESEIPKNGSRKIESPSQSSHHAIVASLEDAELMSLLGFSSFGQSRKKCRY